MISNKFTFNLNPVSLEKLEQVGKSFEKSESNLKYIFMIWFGNIQVDCSRSGVLKVFSSRMVICYMWS